jgi:hypothetical protein
MEFFPIFEDLDPFLRLDLGRKLGGEPKIKIYIFDVFDSPKRFKIGINDEEL